MKSRHRPGPPPWYVPPPPVVDEDYEREVAKSTTRLEQRYRRAQARADRAVTRLATAKKQKASAGSLRELERLVTRRREELEEVRRLMQTTPAGSVHRGRDSYRHL